MPTEREKMLRGAMYRADDPELVAARTRARALCYQLNHDLRTDTNARKQLLTDLLGSGGDSAHIEPPFRCDYGSHIYLGEEVYFNFNCVVLDVCRVTIGDHTLIGPSVQIYTATHPMNAELRRKEEFGQPITIGSDVWIGGGAILCPGITIGDRTVIGAGSVVTKDLPPDVFAAGNPCRVIRAIDQDAND
ncbi:maltose acetyltransferase [Blastopirellula marina]|uniref:Maltose acetyltransferase n=1 Tax=Blastopirellula marina TaxID=124 RepID=A0A2S8F652_9BACT|nr:MULTISPECIES: sugar O-acetyltransferase [Pirellulaceae]PQO27636.1 maltose acetyltransferase [Blastopirellula marina]RCS48174.1 sugar O-acetyltransferase [Bremerella cremea]